MGHIFHASDSAISVAADTDIAWFQVGAGAALEILEIRIWQTSDTTIAMNSIIFERGTAGTPGGTGLTEYEWDSLGPAPVAAAIKNPTGTITGTNLQYSAGWNILQEFVWLPTPKMYLPMGTTLGDELHIRLGTADTLTVGFSITWEEWQT